MAAFDEAAVLAWLGTTPGLAAAQRAAAAGIMAEDEYDGAELVVVEEGRAVAHLAPLCFVPGIFMRGS
jgi:hypothetical protein